MRRFSMLLCAALLGLGAGREWTGEDLLKESERAQLAYVAGWLDGYLQALDGVRDRTQLALWRECLQGRTMEEMRVRVIYYYSRHEHVRHLRLQLTLLDALLEACQRPPAAAR
jgi:hypothetical protein